MKTPIALFIYNRPTNLKRIAKIIRSVNPSKLYVIADGPKDSEDKKRVDEARNILESSINWDCRVNKNYASKNLGLKERFSSGIDWVFTHEDRVIFLEDDCIPDPSFFPYCEELLTKYENNDRVATISGNNFQYGQLPINTSYYFSKYAHVWGWATWKRVWDQYDKDINSWNQLRETSWLKLATKSFVVSKFWTYIFDALQNNQINTWDYQLTYLCLENNMVNIIPAVNLVSNVGYGQEATNTKRRSKAIGIPVGQMSFPLVHPKKISINHTADHRVERGNFLNPIGVISLVIKSILRKL